MDTMDNVPFTLTMFEFALVIWGLVATGLCLYIHDQLNTHKHAIGVMIMQLAEGKAAFVKNADGSVDVLIKQDNQNVNKP
jgi:Ni,Fe-hydrogenase I cytochrome b subunit